MTLIRIFGSEPSR